MGATGALNSHGPAHRTQANTRSVAGTDIARMARPTAGS